MSDISRLPVERPAVVQASAPDAVSTQQLDRQSLPPVGKLLPPDEQQQPSQQQLETAVSQIADFVQNISRELQFSLDADSGRTVVRVFDSETEELVRQIPSEEILNLARRIGRLTPEVATGLLLQGKA